MGVLISVVTAVCNDEKYIEKSVESILKQTFKDIEYIVVDDGSTDNTLAILENIAKKDNRLIILSQKNSGTASARNKGIYTAKGTYIALQDSDDISHSDRLQTQLDHLLRSPYNLISCTSHFIIDTNDKLVTTSNKIYKNINNNILKGRLCFCTPTMMVRKDVVIDVNGYNTFYNKDEDFDLILRLLEHKNYVEKINICLYYYRIRDNSEGSKNNRSYTKRIYNNHLNRINNKPENFAEVINDYKIDKKYTLKRQAGEIFYAEHYFEYLKFYFGNFHRLLYLKFFLYFIYSIIPYPIKKIIKHFR